MIVLLTERQLLILEAVIRNYTESGQPIGSKTLQQRLPVHVSSATIRNEMAVLEQQDYIAKEHSSSGRIPSLKGYRYYVDNIVQPSQLDRTSLKNIRSSFGNEFQKVDEIVATSAQILSDLTSYTAISLKPKAKDIRVEGLRIVPLGNQQVMGILVTSDGTVESQTFTVPAGISSDELEVAMRLLDDKIAGVPLSQVLVRLNDCLPLLSRYLHQPAGFVEVFGSILDKALKEQVYIGGKMNMLDFSKGASLEQIKSLYSLVDQTKIGSLVTPAKSGISVKLGDELPSKLLQNYSLISATFDDGNNGQGMIALLGPTNMPYSKMIGLVSVFRDELTRRITDYYQRF